MFSMSATYKIMTSTAHFIRTSSFYCNKKMTSVQSDVVFFNFTLQWQLDAEWGLTCARLSQVTGGLSSFSQATHSAAGAVVSKPREIATLIRTKFGSTDNIASLKDSLDETQGDEGVGPGGIRTQGTGQLQSSPKYGSDDDCSSATSGSAGANSTTGAPGGPPSSKGNTLDQAQASGFDAVLHEIQEVRDNQGRLEESFANLKGHYERDYPLIMEALQEERYR